jgi:hypothetical protein
VQILKVGGSIITNILKKLLNRKTKVAQSNIYTTEESAEEAAKKAEEAAKKAKEAEKIAKIAKEKADIMAGFNGDVKKFEKDFKIENKTDNIEDFYMKYNNYPDQYLPISNKIDSYYLIGDYLEYLHPGVNNNKINQPNRKDIYNYRKNRENYNLFHFYYPTPGVKKVINTEDIGGVIQHTPTNQYEPKIISSTLVESTPFQANSSNKNRYDYNLLGNPIQEYKTYYRGLELESSEEEEKPTKFEDAMKK